MAFREAYIYKGARVVGLNISKFQKYKGMFSDPSKKTAYGKPPKYSALFNNEEVSISKGVFNELTKPSTKHVGGVLVMHNVASSSASLASSKPKGKRPITRCPKSEIIRFQYADNTSLQRQKVCGGVDPVNITKKQYEKYLTANMKLSALLEPRKIKRGPRKSARPAAVSSSSAPAAEKKKRVRKALTCAQRNRRASVRCLNRIPKDLTGDVHHEYVTKCEEQYNKRNEECTRDPTHRFRVAKGEGKKKASTGKRPGRPASGNAKPRRLKCIDLRKRVYSSCKKPTPRKKVVRTNKVCGTISKRRYDKCQSIGTGPRRVVKPKGILNEVFGTGLFD